MCENNVRLIVWEENKTHRWREEKKLFRRFVAYLRIVKKKKSKEYFTLSWPDPRISLSLVWTREHVNCGKVDKTPTFTIPGQTFFFSATISCIVYTFLPHSHIYRHKNTLYIMFLYMFCLPNGFQFIPWTKRTHMQQNHRDGQSYFANV